MNLATLKIEWLKVKNYPTFWVMSLLFSVLLTVFYILTGLGVINAGAGGLTIFGKADSFAVVWDDLCFFASYFVIALAILMAIVTTNEFQYRTNRQNIIDGWTRMQFYHGKWQLLLAICLATTIFVFVLGLVAGMLSGLPISGFTDNIIKLLWLFLLCVNYLGFALLLSLIFKRSGLTIGILMFYSMIIEAILHTIFLFKLKFPVGDLFLPLQASDELLPLGASKMLRMAVPSDFNPEAWHYATATMGWIILYYIAGRIKLVKSDW
jgi:ABC-2 type transport system permease protein